MSTLARRSQRATNIWPGFVDALATLLMVVIFLLMVFVLAQLLLSEALSGRDAALQRLNTQVSELSDLLALERKNNEDMRVNLAQLTEELQASVRDRDQLNATVQSLTSRAETAEKRAEAAEKRAGEVEKRFAAAGEKFKAQASKINDLVNQVAALQALKEELEKEVTKRANEVAEKSGALKKSELALIEQRKISESARAQLALLNKQTAALREQLARLSKALEISETKTKEQQVQIASLGKRLNAALATKVQELSRYRSEFFGRLRKILGNEAGIRVVGDRFVFQSEVLFDSGSAQLGTEGKVRLWQLATTLKEISRKIPKDIDWILRVDGHTDKLPIRTAKFPSNWELSTARAISVVRFLIGQGLPPKRLAAAGFGEFQPLDARDDEIAYRRNRRIELKLTQR